MAAAWRFFGVLEGVGSIETGSMVGCAIECEGPSESECVLPFLILCELNNSFLGVL